MAFILISGSSREVDAKTNTKERVQDLEIPVSALNRPNRSCDEHKTKLNMIIRTCELQIIPKL